MTYEDCSWTCRLGDRGQGVSGRSSTSVHGWAVRGGELHTAEPEQGQEELADSLLASPTAVPLIYPLSLSLSLALSTFDSSTLDELFRHFAITTRNTKHPRITRFLHYFVTCKLLLVFQNHVDVASLFSIYVLSQKTGEIRDGSASYTVQFKTRSQLALWREWREFQSNIISSDFTELSCLKTFELIFQNFELIDIIVVAAQRTCVVLLSSTLWLVEGDSPKTTSPHQSVRNLRVDRSHRLITGRPKHTALVALYICNLIHFYTSRVVTVVRSSHTGSRAVRFIIIYWFCQNTQLVLL